MPRWIFSAIYEGVAMMEMDGRIMSHGSPVRKTDREMYKSEVKPCKTIKLSREELDKELRKISVEEKPMMQNTLIKEDMERLLDEELSCDEIVNATGLSKACVIQKAKRYGLEISMRMNEKPKQADTIPAVQSKQKRVCEPKMTKPKHKGNQRDCKKACERSTGKRDGQMRGKETMQNHFG